MCDLEIVLKLWPVSVSTEEPERLTEEYFQDPHRFHDRLRQRRPVAPVIMPGGAPAWLVTRYDHARAALADPRLGKDWRKIRQQEMVADPVYAALEAHMLNSDPPDHARLRKLVNKAFTPRQVERLRPRVAAITSSLLDAIDGAGEVDLVKSYAFPLPITVISELLGLPSADQDNFRRWSALVVAESPDPAEFDPAIRAMNEFFTALLAAKRAKPADDLLSALIQAREADDRLTDDEIVSMMFLLMIAGHETTVNLIASGILTLLLNPGEQARLRADPALLPGAVEELLRVTSPVNTATFRFTMEPAEIGGVLIPANELVVIALSSANRDPSRYRDPDATDVGRDAGGHLAFGHGIHYCLGAPLARLEGEIALGALLARFPHMRLAVPAADLRWRPSALIRGLEALPVLPGGK